MSEHDRLVVWEWLDVGNGPKWAAACDCGENFGSHETAVEAIDAARPHFAGEER